MNSPIGKDEVGEKAKGLIDWSDSSSFEKPVYASSGQAMWAVSISNSNNEPDWIVKLWSKIESTLLFERPKKANSMFWRAVGPGFDPCRCNVLILERRHDPYSDGLQIHYKLTSSLYLIKKKNLPHHSEA